MKRKSRGKNVRVIILTLRKDGTRQHLDSRIYLQVNRRPRRLKLNDVVIRMQESWETIYQYIWSAKADHKKYVRKINEILKDE